MDPFRAKIFFDESLSDQASLQKKCLILVPRSECPTIRTLKEHIRNKFSISEGQHLELSIDGFFILDWEKTEVIRENDVICVHAKKANSLSHNQDEEGSNNKKKRKRPRELEKSESRKGEETQVQDGPKSNKKKKIQDRSKIKKDNETSSLNKVQYKLKREHKEKNKKQKEGKSKKRKQDKNSENPESLAENKCTEKVGKDKNDKNNQNEEAAELKNDTVTNELEVQTSVSSVEGTAGFSQVCNVTNSQDVCVNGQSTADESIVLNSGVIEASDKGSVQKKRRRRRRKRKSNMINTGNGDFLEGSPSNGLSNPGCPPPRNGMLQPDRTKHCTRAKNGKQNKSTIPKDESVASVTSGGHIVFESESDSEKNPQKLQKSEQALEALQSEEMTTGGAPCEVVCMTKQPDQQHEENLVEGSMKNGSNGKNEESAFNCVTPPEGVDEVSGENTLQIPVQNNYDSYPPLNGPPRNGDVIAFKMLELSSEYTPEVSEYREGVVIEFNANTQSVGIQLTTGFATNRDMSEMSEGRFEMELDDDWTTDRNQQRCASLINVHLTSMIEPKLLSV